MLQTAASICCGVQWPMQMSPVSPSSGMFRCPAAYFENPENLQTRQILIQPLTPNPCRPRIHLPTIISIRNIRQTQMSRRDTPTKSNPPLRPHGVQMSGNRAKINRSQPARQPGKSTPDSAPDLVNEPAPNSANGPEWGEMSGNEREIEKTDLTFRQQSALPIIAASPSIAQAASASGIGESTLRRWLEEESFRDELARLRQESASLARQELQGLMLRSVSVLAEAMNDPDVTVRLRAARYSMSFAVQICEAEKLRSDIQALEEALPLWAAHHAL